MWWDVIRKALSPELPPVAQSINTSALLRHEACEIEGAILPASLDSVELNRALNRLDRTALCLSGGGIRSATFALGVMQALATYPRSADGEPASPEASLLGRFRYLSTVSGGGYIGSWLSAWLSRQSFDQVQIQLTQRPEGPDREPQPIGNLRRDSNYLTPKIGLTSADTWTAATIVVRNLTLVWLLVVSALASLLLLLKLILVTLTFVGATGSLAENYYSHAGLLAAGTLLLMLGQRYTLVNYAEGDEGGSQWDFIRWDLLFAIAGGTLLTTWAILPIGVEKWAPATLNVMLIGPTIFIASGLLSYPAHQNQKHSRLLRLLRWVMAGLVWSAVVLAGIHLFVAIDYAPARLLTLAVLGPPWFLMAQITAETVYVAETSTETRSDAQREWFARAAGWFVAAGLFWTVSTVLGLLGSRLADLLRTETNLLYHSLLGGGLAATAAMGLLGGRKDSPKVVGGFARLVKFIQLAGGQAFLALVLIIISALLDYIVLGTSLLEVLLAPVKRIGTTIADKDTGLDTLLFGSKVDVMTDASNLVPLLFGVFVLMAVVSWVVSRTVNINRFSLHGLYRNRLVRAYLGATHTGRQPNPFTGFDLDDNPPMHKLWPEQGLDRSKPAIGRLYHVVNCTLNVVSTRNNAWQQRKAMSFVVTPCHAGAADLCPVTPRGFRGAFQPSAKYGGKDGISLGTAMAISGAAANPNMGYNSAPSITLLFALFNVRLGWWLANPGPSGRRFWDLAGPRQALVPWFQEAFGQTTADRAYVNLSDGGHFENLGLYEMVRRRCRLIVLSDAGCDPAFTFADLGNAVRKIHIDLGICLTFPDLDRLKPRILSGAEPSSGPYCTVGRIHYRDADGAGEDGYILYIKPGYHGTEGAGVCAYANESPTFPHESTADQWFSESQFESYRSLGFQIVDGLFARVGHLAPDATLLHYVQAIARDIARPSEPGKEEPDENEPANEVPDAEEDS